MSKHRAAVAFIGPSGAGKSTVARALHRRGVILLHPTWTTRPRRGDEPTDTLEHRFVSDAVFDEMASVGGFAATAVPFGLPYRYGLPRPVLAGSGPVDAFIVRARFVDLLAAAVPRLVVYQIRTDAVSARVRLLARGGPGSESSARVRDNEMELALGERLAARTFMTCGPVDDVVDSVCAALLVDVAAVA